MPLQLSAAALEALDKIKEHNELEFIEQDNPSEPIKWLIALLTLFIGKRALVDSTDLTGTWQRVKPVLQEQIVSGGLGTSTLAWK